MLNKRIIDFSALIQNQAQDFTGREWVFTALDQWLGDPAGSRVFLITGEPGSGKSTIIARLASLSQAEAHQAGYAFLGAWGACAAHFCSSRNLDTIIPQVFIDSLSSSLVGQIAGFNELLLQDSKDELGLHNQYSDIQGGVEIGNIIFRQSLAAAFDTLVSTPLARLACSGFSSQIIIMIDGLDQGWIYNDPDNNIPTLIASAVIHSTSFPSQVRFLLTSRSDPRVLRYIGKPTLDLIADEPVGRDEIADYATARLAGSTKVDPVSLSTRISAACQGNFLFARHLIDDLEARREDPGELHVPRSLWGVYRWFLEREIGRDVDLWYRRYRPLLEILVVALGEGLTPWQLAGITDLPFSETQSGLRDCGQFLRGPWPVGPFRIFHWSMAEYLMSGDLDFHVDDQKAHSRIVDFFFSEYTGEWVRCDDVYCLRYLPQHLIAIINDQDPNTRRESIAMLASLLTDPGFLNARRELVSAEIIRNEANAALALTGEGSRNTAALLALIQAGQNLPK